MKAVFRLFYELPVEQKKITLSTKLTILRILLVPFIVYLMVNRYLDVAFLLIVISSLSDLFDGIIARARNECTIIGACLDPIADKLFIISCYFIFSFGYLPNFLLPWWFTLIMLAKEMCLIIGAVFVVFKKQNIDIKPTWIGKFAMDIQTFFVLWVFVSYFFNCNSIIFSKIILFFVIVFVLLSFIQYVKLYKSHILRI